MGSNAQTSCESSLIFLSFHEILSFSRSPTTSLCLPSAKHSPTLGATEGEREKKSFHGLMPLCLCSPAAVLQQERRRGTGIREQEIVINPLPRISPSLSPSR